METTEVIVVAEEGLDWWSYLDEIADTDVQDTTRDVVEQFEVNMKGDRSW